MYSSVDILCSWPLLMRPYRWKRVFYKFEGYPAIHPLFYLYSHWLAQDAYSHCIKETLSTMFRWEISSISSTCTGYYVESSVCKKKKLKRSNSEFKPFYVLTSTGLGGRFYRLHSSTLDRTKTHWFSEKPPR